VLQGRALTQLVKALSYKPECLGSVPERCFKKNVEGIKTHILYSAIFSENRVVYEKMWKNISRSWQAKDETTV